MALIVLTGQPSLPPVHAGASGGDVGIAHLTKTALASLAIVRLGGEASLWAHRTDDLESDRIATKLNQSGVDVRYYRPSLAAAATVGRLDSGNLYSSSWLPLDHLSNAAALYLDTSWANGASRAADAAQQQKLPVVLDGQPDSPATWEVAERCTHVLIRESTANEAGGPQSLIQRMRDKGIWAAVTLGRRGVLYSGGHLLAYRVPPLHQEGAGDVFRGAFTLAIAESRSEFDALRFATAAAALYVERGSPPSRQAVLDLLVEY